MYIAAEFIIAMIYREIHDVVKSDFFCISLYIITLQHVKSQYVMQVLE